MYQKSYREIFETMRNYVISHQDKITDFNEGSAVLSLIEAPARELAALYNKCIANIELYAKDMAYAQFDFKKKDGLPAGGSVRFSRNASSSMEVNIPQGSKVSTSDGLQFETTADGKIASGATSSGLVPVSCTKVGDIGNVGIHKINTIVYSLYGVDSVQNDNALSGGVNEETDEEYSARFSEFIIGLGKSSISGVRSTALSINGVRSVSVVEHFPAEGGFNFTLYAENGSGALPIGTKKMIEEVIVGTQTVEGVRACGINARILAPSIIYVNVTIIFRVDGTIPAGLIEDEIRKNVTNYINGLKIGQSYEKKIVNNMAMRQAGVQDINTNTPNLTTATMRQIIRPGTINVEGV
jgi:uncharacterized phage protein gp47/JayE